MVFRPLAFLFLVLAVLTPLSLGLEAITRAQICDYTIPAGPISGLTLDQPWSGAHNLVMPPAAPRDYLLPASVSLGPGAQRASSVLVCRAFCPALPRDAMLTGFRVNLLATVEPSGAVVRIQAVRLVTDQGVQWNSIPGAFTPTPLKVDATPIGYDLSENKLMSDGASVGFGGSSDLWSTPFTSGNVANALTTGFGIVVGPSSDAFNRTVRVWMMEGRFSWTPRSVGARRGIGLFGAATNTVAMTRLGVSQLETTASSTAYSLITPEPPASGEPVRYLVGDSSPVEDYKAVMATVSGGTSKNVLMFRRGDELWDKLTRAAVFGAGTNLQPTAGLKFFASGRALSVFTKADTLCSAVAGSSPLSFLMYDGPIGGRVWNAAQPLSAVEPLCGAAGSINFARVTLVASRTTDSALLLAQDLTGASRVVVPFSGSSWVQSQAFLIPGVGSGGPADAAAVFLTSDQKMIAYGKSGQPKVFYRLLAAGTSGGWGTEASTASPTFTDCTPRRIFLEPHPSTDTVLLMVQCEIGTTSRIWFALWDSALSAWGNFGSFPTTTASPTTGNPSVLVTGAFSMQSFKTLVMAVDTEPVQNGRIFYATFTGTAWVSGIAMNGQGTIPRFINLAANPFGNDMVLTVQLQSQLTGFAYLSDPSALSGGAIPFQPQQNAPGAFATGDQYEALFLWDRHTDPACPVGTMVPDTLPVRQLICPPTATLQCRNDAFAPPTMLPSTVNCQDFPAPTFTNINIQFTNPLSPNDGRLTRNWTGCGPLTVPPYSLPPPVTVLGNNQCSQLVTVLDTTPPVIVCPADLTVPCGAIESGSFTGDPLSVSDNCGVGFTVSSTTMPFACGLTFTRTHTVVDQAGNSAACSFQITVTGGNSAAFCPPFYVAECPSALGVQAVGVTGVASFSNCAFNARLLDTVEATCGDTQNVTRVFSACGASCSQRLRTRDTTPPVWVKCPLAPVGILCSNLTLGLASLAPPSATDTCGNVTVFFIDPPQLVCGTSFLRNWMAQDSCGNNAVCQQVIHVSPASCTEPPHLWGADCSCTAPPPIPGAVCSRCSWIFNGDATVVDVLDLGFDALSVSGTLQLDETLSLSLGNVPCKASGLRSSDEAEPRAAQRSGRLQAGCVRMSGDALVRVYDAPSNSTLDLISSGCAMADLFTLVRAVNVTTCASFPSPYQLPSTTDTRLALVVIPDTSWCPPPPPWAIIFGVVGGVLVCVLIALLIVAYVVWVRKRKLALEMVSAAAKRKQVLGADVVETEMSSLDGHLREGDQGIDGQSEMLSRLSHASASRGSLGLSGSRSSVTALFLGDLAKDETLHESRDGTLAMSPRAIIRSIKAATVERQQVEDAQVTAMAERLRETGATLRGKTIEGMTSKEQRAAALADSRLEHDHELQTLYDRAVRRKRQRCWTRIIILLLTLAGAALAAYAIVEFMQFQSLTSASAALSGNSTQGILKFVPPGAWADLAVRSQCRGSALCYDGLLQQHSARIASWDQYLIGHQPEADLSVLINIILASLVLDFVSLALLGVAMTVAVLESRGYLPKKSSRPYVYCFKQPKRIDVFLVIDMVLFFASVVLLVASVLVAYTTPLVLVPTSTVERAEAFERIDFDPATGVETRYYFFRFASSASSTSVVKARISNFDDTNPLISFRPWVRQRCLTPRAFDRSVAFIRSLNSPALTQAQQDACVAEFTKDAAFVPPASCDALPQSDCFPGPSGQGICCQKKPTSAEPFPELACGCTQASASSSSYCCTLQSGGTTSITDCSFRGPVTKGPECFPPRFTPSPLCSIRTDRDPPLTPALRQSLWSVCPFERISFNSSTFCINYSCTGSAEVQVNATDALKAAVQQQIAQGIGIDVAATLLDGFGAILEHFAMPRIARPIVLS